MHSYIQLVILVALGCIVKAEFTCFTGDDEKKTTESCPINQCFVIYRKSEELRQYGCIIKMKEEQRSYCSRNAALCKTCKKENCNTPDLLKLCISCKTQGTGGDDRCTIDPGQLKRTHVTACRLGCITYIRPDGTNNRECLTLADDCDYGNCDECSGDFCNDEIYPANRIVCRTKNGKEVCLKNTDTCLNVLGADGWPMEAGCTEHMLKKNPKLNAMCEKFPSRCAKCATTECNEKKQYQQCLRCDQSDKDCLDAPDSIKQKEVEYCSGQCYLDVLGDSVKRGCSDDYICEEEHCVLCDGPFCRDAPVTPKLCFIDKENVNKCTDPKDKCVSIFNHKTGVPVKQSCLKELEEEDRKICEVDPSRCDICEENHCNEWKEKLRCVTCSGPDCVKPDETETKVCSYGECYTKTLPDGTNERGCASENLECKKPDCTICTRDVCNKEIFPEDRRSCQDDNGKSHYCSKVDDECYTTVVSDGGIKRGCLEEASIPCDSEKCHKCATDECNSGNICLQCQDNKSCSNPGYCFATDPGCFSMVLDGEMEKGCKKIGFCEGQTYCYECTGDNCNTKEPVVDGTKCHKCQGEGDCIGEQNGEPTACNLRDDECYVIIDGARAERGCASNITCEGGNCQKCTGVGCNSFTLEKQTCYQCDQNNEGCGPELDEQLIQPTECSYYHFPDQKSFCFTDFAETKRGCLPSESSICQDSAECSSCNEPACNNVTIHNNRINASTYLRSTYITWIMTIFTIGAAIKLRSS